MNVGAKARRRRPVYVESRVQASLGRAWDATQQPDQHQRWGVRFGSISYLPGVDGEPQRFTYAATVAPGLTSAGTGGSLANRDRAGGTRWSGLKFRALADPTRRQILQDLRDSEMTAGGIASQFPVSGPATSRQLSILKLAGLDTEHREANRIHYALGVIPYRAGAPHLR